MVNSHGFFLLAIYYFLTDTKYDRIARSEMYKKKGKRLYFTFVIPASLAYHHPYLIDIINMVTLTFDIPEKGMEN